MHLDIRKDDLLDSYVLVAQDPSFRPRPHVPFTTPLTRPCLFCPERADGRDALHQYPDRGPWYIKVLPTKTPTLRLDDLVDHTVSETIIEVPQHSLAAHDLPAEHLARIFEIQANRIDALARDKKIKHVHLNKSSLAPMHEHAHSQLFGAVALTERIKNRFEKILGYRKATGRCVGCDVMKRERKTDRLIYEDAFVTAFAPYASRHPYEVVVMPRRHLHSLTTFSPDEYLAMAQILKQVMVKIARLGLPYAYSIDEAISCQDEHICLKISPQISIWSHEDGLEGIFINPISPEAAASYFRQL